MAIEDLTSYTESDESSVLSLTGTNKANFTALPRNLHETLFSYDYTADHFGDFEWLYEGYLSSADMGANYAAECWIGASTVAASLVDMTYFVGSGLSGRTGGGGEYFIHLLEVDDGVEGDVDTYYACSLDTLYYFTLTRSGAAVTLKIYDDSGRTNLVDTLEITAIENALRYSIVAASHWEDSAAEDSSITGYYQDLDLQEDVGISIPAAMHHYKMMRAS